VDSNLKMRVLMARVRSFHRAHMCSWESAFKSIILLLLTCPLVIHAASDQFQDLNLDAETLRYLPMSLDVPATNYEDFLQKSIAKMQPESKDGDRLKAVLAVTSPELFLFSSQSFFAESEDTETQLTAGLTSIRNLNLKSSLFADKLQILQQGVVPEANPEIFDRLRKEIILVRTDKYADDLGGRPVGEYCLGDLAKGPPVNATTTLSVFDLAIAEASRSNLDLELLKLLLQPDPFQTALQADLSARSRDDEVTDQQTDWDLLFDKWDGAVRSGKMAPKLKFRDWLAGSKAKKEPLGPQLADFAKRGENYCQQQRGQWSELTASTQFQLAGTSRISDLFRCTKTKSGLTLQLSLVRNEDHLRTLDFKIRDNRKVLYFATLDQSTSYSQVILNQLADQFVFDKNRRLTSWSRQDGSKRSAYYQMSQDHRPLWSSASVNQQIVERFWDSKSGSLSGLLIYDAKTARPKIYASWHSPKIMRHLLRFDDGRPHGLETWWYADGQPAGEANWFAGKKFGSARLYFPNGKVMYDASYVDDKLDGAVFWRDEHDQIVFSGQFRAGRAEGTVEIRQGITLASAVFKGGQVDGDARIGADKQTPVTVIPFKDGAIHGTVDFKDLQGRSRLTIPYVNGRIHGNLVAHAMRENGPSQCKYDDGHLIEWTQSCSALSSANSPCQIAGGVSDLKTNRSTVKISNRDGSLSTQCDTNDELWQDCHFNIAHVPQVFNLRTVKDQFDVKKSNNCQLDVQNWDLSPWIDLGEAFAILDIVPNSQCKEAAAKQCLIKLVPGLPLHSCKTARVVSQNDY
jgi:hypothetical protein